MAKEILYLECYSGISGDMTVGALLDLGASREVLEKTLAELQLEGYHLHFGRTTKCAIDAYDFDVHLEHHHDHAHETEDGHSHDVNELHAEENPQIHEAYHEHEHEHDHDHEHEHEHHHDHDHDHHHDHDHDHDYHHDHDHGHDHHHGHDHVHRHMHDIEEILDRLSNPHVKEKALKMFQIVAEAESKAHGVPVEEVHFHEVGAVDSIVDIVSVACLMEDLGIDDVAVSPLYEGCGHVRNQHGILPVPVPAVVNIAQANGLRLKITDTMGEMITPTGAAIAAAYQTRKNLPASYEIKAVGIGAGKKDFPKANILRAMILSVEG